MAACASRNFAAVILNGAPPLRPRARAAAIPARVRSVIKARSNSASAAKIPNTSLPAAVVVSIAAPSPVSTLRPTPRTGEVVHQVDQVAQIAAEPVELPDHQGVALSQGFDAGEQPGSVIASAGSKILIQVSISDAGRDQGFALEVEHL